MLTQNCENHSNSVYISQFWLLFSEKPSLNFKQSNHNCEGEKKSEFWDKMLQLLFIYFTFLFYDGSRIS